MNENEVNQNTGVQCFTRKDDRMSVLDFFSGKKVFLTGGSGFLGKVLIDKMLRELHVETIYMLVREKKGKGAHSRVDAITDNPYFDELKKVDPKFKHRIVPINGDCVLAGLGCSLTDIQTLIEHVDIVIHCAATVRFDERLDVAFNINVTGTRSVINLCHQMKRLKAFLHMSTAYSNCHLLHIEEKFYDYQHSAEEIATLLSKMDVDELVARTPNIIRGWPNTYSFTKALAESLVRREAANLPTVVLRPAIVLSTLKGAVPGWTDNLYGPVSATASTFVGFMRVSYIKEDHSCNVVPVDKVVDTALAAIWELGTRSERVTGDIKIYNYVSSNTPNEITWAEYYLLCTHYGRQYPSLRTFRDISCIATHNILQYYMYCLLFHFIPALLVDFGLLITGKTPRMFKLYKKGFRLMESVLFFILHSWTFADGNVHALYDTLNPSDRRLLPMNMADVNWKAYLQTYLLGIRRFLIKDDEATIEPARKRYAIIHTVSVTARHLLVFFCVKYAYDTFCSMAAGHILA